MLISMPCGRGELAGTDDMAKPGVRHSWPLSSLVCHDSWNEKKYDPGLAPSLDFPSTSSPNLAPAAHSEPRAASSSIISLTWLVRKPTPSLQIRPGCSILYQVLKYTVKFLVALIAPTLSSHPFPAEAKPPLCSHSAQLTVAWEDALESLWT